MFYAAYSVRATSSLKERDGLCLDGRTSTARTFSVAGFNRRQDVTQLQTQHDSLCIMYVQGAGLYCKDPDDERNMQAQTQP